MAGAATAILLIIAVGLGLVHCSAARAQQRPGTLPPLPIDDVPEEESLPDDSPVERAEIPCDTLFPDESPADIKRRVNRILKSKHLVGAEVGILAVAYPEGQVLYEKDANKAVNPASVTKLFTAAAALTHFGIEKSFETVVFREEGGCGRLYLKGGGDPGLSSSELKKLAGKVKKAGVDCVDTVMYDASLFDENNLPPHYDEKETDAHWRPRIGAVGFADGAITLHVQPGDYVGAAPTVDVEPPCSCVMVDSRATTTEMPGEKGLEVLVSTLKKKVVVRISGEVAQTREDGVYVRRAMPDPDLYAAWFFRDALEEQGITVKGSRPGQGSVPSSASRVAFQTSDPLKGEIKRMQLWSKNFVAEQLLKLFGEGECAPLTFECGLAVFRKALGLFHLGEQCLQLENASGLFDANRVAPAHVVRLLIEAANRSDISSEFMEALPEGRKSGTLKERMVRLKTRVRGKTGTLDNISTLAGYIERKRGRYIAFAIFFTNASASARRLRSLQDQIVEVLAFWKPHK